MKLSQFREKDRKRVVIARLVITLIVIAAFLICEVVLMKALGKKADSEGTWMWLDGTAMEYTHWSENEPNGTESENYGVLGTLSDGVADNGWIDVNGADSYAFVCEWDEELINTSKALVIGQAEIPKKSYSYGAESENYGMYYYSTDSGFWNDGNFERHAPYVCEWEE